MLKEILFNMGYFCICKNLTLSSSREDCEYSLDCKKNVYRMNIVLKTT